MYRNDIKHTWRMRIEDVSNRRAPLLMTNKYLSLCSSSISYWHSLSWSLTHLHRCRERKIIKFFTPVVTVLKCFPPIPEYIFKFLVPLPLLPMEQWKRLCAASEWVHFWSLPIPNMVEFLCAHTQLGLIPWIFGTCTTHPHTSSSMY